MNADNAVGRCTTWLDVVTNLAHHPRTEIVPLPSGCLLVPQQYTRLQRSFLDLLEATRHLRQAAQCLWWSWLGVRAALGDFAIYYVGRFRCVADFNRKKDVMLHCE